VTPINSPDDYCPACAALEDQLCDEHAWLVDDAARVDAEHDEGWTA
jgi:hypothetical protein